MDIIKSIEHFTTTLSGIVWPFFLPILLLLSIYVGFKTVVFIRPHLKKESVKFKHFVGPVSIALSAMVGTGGTVGVLGGLSKVTILGQVYFEAMALWAVIGACILVPLAYSETIIAKLTNSPPHIYLARLIHPMAGKAYLVSFICLYIFAFGGIQFSGIDTAINVINNNFFGLYPSQMERYLFVILPMIAFAVGVVLTKVHSFFINTLAFMISFAVFSYCIFFTSFVIITADYIPVFVERMVLGLTQPVNMLAGVPVAIILGVQRIIQTAESGLGALGMASLEAKSKPREAGIISLIPSVLTVFIAIVITTYIASYGVSHNLFSFGPEIGPIERLTGYIVTATTITGNAGLIVMLLFITLSGLSTLLASYYFLGKLTTFSENTRIFIYLCFLMCAGTLATFGFTIVFDVLDLLMFAVTGLNSWGLAVFVHKIYKEYLKKAEGKL